LEENSQLRAENKDLRQEDHFLVAQTEHILHHTSDETKPEVAAKGPDDVGINAANLPQPEALTQLASTAHEESQADARTAHGDATGLFTGTTRAAKRLHRWVQRIGANAMRMPRSALKSLRDSTRYETAVQELKDSEHRLDRGVAAVAKGAVSKQNAARKDIEDALREAYEAGAASGREGSLEEPRLDDAYKWWPGHDTD
jgi:hypothetical protein